MQKTFKFSVLSLLTLSMTMLQINCVEPQTVQQTLKHPDAPMLIMEIKGDTARVAIWNAERGMLQQYGWVKIPTGWTLTKFNWEQYHVKPKTGSDSSVDRVRSSVKCGMFAK